jgi:hypothetical protein
VFPKEFHKVPYTRWNFNFRVVNTVYENVKELKECFEELQSKRIFQQSKQLQDSYAYSITSISSFGFLSSTVSCHNKNNLNLRNETKIAPFL